MLSILLLKYPTVTQISSNSDFLQIRWETNTVNPDAGNEERHNDQRHYDGDDFGLGLINYLVNYSLH